MVSLIRKKKSSYAPARKNFKNLIFAIILACVMCVYVLQISFFPNRNNDEGLALGSSSSKSKAQDESYGLFDDVTDLMCGETLEEMQI